jgi:uncharacterized membrane protein YbjE (DUF340 family)
MIKVLIIMAAGIAFGALARNKKKLIKANNKSIIWIIFLLLFFMGVSVGKNGDIMNNLDTIGLRGLQLAFVAVLGSVLLSWIIYKAFFKNGTDKTISNSD